MVNWCSGSRIESRGASLDYRRLPTKNRNEAKITFLRLLQKRVLRRRNLITLRNAITTPETGVVHALVKVKKSLYNPLSAICTNHIDD